MNLFIGADEAIPGLDYSEKLIKQFQHDEKNTIERLRSLNLI